LKELALLLEIEKNHESTLAFCSNGTTGMNTVLKSLPSIIARRDNSAIRIKPIKIMCASTIYPAVYSTLLSLPFPTQIIIIPIQYPISDDDYIYSIESEIRGQTDIDFAVFDW
jgi:hypothetical protein